MLATVPRLPHPFVLPYGRWLRFAVPGALLVSIVGFIGIALAG